MIEQKTEGVKEGTDLIETWVLFSQKYNYDPRNSFPEFCLRAQQIYFWVTPLTYGKTYCRSKFRSINFSEISLTPPPPKKNSENKAIQSFH